MKKQEVEIAVVRGGCIWYGAAYVRVAYRNWNSPGLSGDDLGFRIVRIIREAKD